MRRNKRKYERWEHPKYPATRAEPVVIPDFETHRIAPGTVIPCFVLIWYDYDTIVTALNALLRRPELQLHVIENKSRHTDTKIGPFVMTQMDKGRVAEYIRFDKNIAASAFKITLQLRRDYIASLPYVLITDGDIDIETGWLDKAHKLLEHDPDIWCAGCNISRHNGITDALSQKHGEIRARYRPLDAGFGKPRRGPRYDRGIYIESESETQLLLFRGKEYAGFIDWLGDKPFFDVQMAEYCREVIKKKWVRVKYPMGTHLTWSLYHDLENPYLHFKLKKPLYDIWHVQRTCPYTIITPTDIKRVLLPDTGSVYGTEFGE